MSFKSFSENQTAANDTKKAAVGDAAAKKQVQGPPPAEAQAETKTASDAPDAD